MVHWVEFRLWLFDCRTIKLKRPWTRRFITSHGPAHPLGLMELRVHCLSWSCGSIEPYGPTHPLSPHGLGRPLRQWTGGSIRPHEPYVLSPFHSFLSNSRISIFLSSSSSLDKTTSKGNAKPFGFGLQTVKHGKIPTSSSPGPSTNLEYLSLTKERIKEGFGAQRPWKLMFNIHSINVLGILSKAISRVRTNVAYFRMNKAIFVLLILFISLM